MERHPLEDRIRASLQARADDVVPTPELWERVSARTTRRARWQLGAWTLTGAAAVAALVVGGVVLLGSPRGVEIAPEPDVMHTPSTAPSDPTPAVGGGQATIVTTDGTRLFVVDPATGETVTELDPRGDLVEGGRVHEVAVRPGSAEDALTVAMTQEVEGMFQVEVAVFDASGQRVDRLTLGGAGGPGTSAGLPPEPVWSADGRYVLWAGANGRSGPGLWIYDWVERPVDGDGLAQVTTATAPGADDELFAAGETVDLHGWTGPSDGVSTLVATTPTGRAWRVELTAQASDCGGVEPCPPTWQAAVTPFGMEGGSLVDLERLGNGVELALVARSGDGEDAESGSVALLAGPMSDQQRALDIPEPSGTASPNEGWLAAAGDQAVVGYVGQAHLLTIAGDTIEDTEVADTVALPEGTVAAGMAPAVGGTPAPPEATPATPTVGPSEGSEAAVLDDGVPAHVITLTSAGDLQLVDRRDPDRPVLSWPRPDGTVAEEMPSHVAVHPDSTPTDLQLVSRWTVGEAETLVHTVVRDGQVVVNESLPRELQPDNGGPITEMAESAPVFSPSGDWLAWVEAPDGGDGPAQVRMVGWGADGPTGASRSEPAPSSVTRPNSLVDWARTSGGDVLTMTPASDAEAGIGSPAAMTELHLTVTSSLVAETSAEDWRTVELPGILLDAGSFDADGGAERYLAFAGDEQVRYGLAEAPGSAVPTGAVPYSEGRVVAFGPGSALVQRADGGWQRVQVDDGAASPVEVPDGTVAVLPWPQG